MSETSNDIPQRGPDAETPADETRMAAPSRSDIARGAAPAQWAPSELVGSAEMQAQPQAVGEFGLAKSAEALGLPADTIAGARAWLAGDVQFTDQQLAQFDSEHEAAAITELRALWGDKFISNFKTIDAYLDSLPGHAGVVFKQARDGNGKALANDPATLQRVLGQAQLRQGTTLAGGLNEQIAAIERTMRTDRAAYNRDELLQARYRELLTMRERAR